MGKTFYGVVSAAVEQFRRKANMVAQGVRVTEKCSSFSLLHLRLKMDQ